jgi:MFS family permease
MYDPIPTRIKPLWWEGLAGVGYALVAVSASILLYNFAQDDRSAAWRWALLIGVIAALLVGAVRFSRWADRHRRAVRESSKVEATPPQSS